ncbi:MAG: tetratricopeptide repeat protein [Limisphaerales bacterium]
MDPNPIPSPSAVRRAYQRAVGPRLRWLLTLVFGLTALLSANSAYLLAITTLEWLKGLSYQNYFYQLMFLAHLVLGLLLVVPFVAFCAGHIRNAWRRKNRNAVRMGWLLFASSLVLLLSGIALMRVEGFELKDPRLRSVSYWAHIITPVLVVWLYVLHRLTGPRIKWKAGLAWGGAMAVIVLGMVAAHTTDPRKWSVVGPQEGEKYFHPSSSRTATGNFIPADTLMMDRYCMECHEDAYEGWFHSAHHFSSFNNPAYLFSIKETRAVALERDGDVKASRWCAGCHDPVPFFSGAFDDPDFDLENHPTSQAGITCTACHSIVNVNSTTGNGDYTIEEPIHYPFAFSTNRLLAYINRQLVKAKPDFHKKVFLKPLHQTSEFCSTCHKVSIPRELNHYKDWLRGQNSYDGFLLSGVSGHGARSFYYPEHATGNCAGCHMPLQESKDFGAQYFNPTNRTLSIHDHFFPAANTALPYLRGEPENVLRHQAFLTNTLRVDLFGLKEGGTIDAPLLGPLRPTIPALKPGRTYLLEVVVRTLTLGHPYTQGTADSNESWLDVQATSGKRTVGRSGGLGPHREVDPWSHFLNVYMLDKDGHRIDRRNPQDIFTPLYDHQIGPGAAQVVHYTFTVPPELAEPFKVEVKLQYRKFDTVFANYFLGQGWTNGLPFQVTNDLPITTIATDAITFPVEGLADSGVVNPPSPIPEWQRWNDYGIGLLLEGDKGSEKGELLQADQAFAEVERLGRWDGPVNRARVLFKEGRLDDAVAALQRAAKSEPPAPRWLVAWFNGQVNKQNGYLDTAIDEFRSIVEDRDPALAARGFDFSKDYLVLNELGQTLFERAKMERGDVPARTAFLREAVRRFEQTLALDSEDLAAHYNLALIQAQLGDETKAAEHRRLHEKYRPDNNARDRAVAAERRRNPAADHAAQSIVLYPLQRTGAPELTVPPTETTILSRP